MKIAGKPVDDSDGKPMPLTKADEEKDGHESEHVGIEFWGEPIPEGTMGRYGDSSGALGSSLDIMSLEDREMLDYYAALRMAKPTTARLNGTYKAIRVISSDYNLYYAVWCTNETELYDQTVSHPFILTWHNLIITSSDGPGPDAQPLRPFALFTSILLHNRRPIPPTRRNTPRQPDDGAQVMQGRIVRTPMADSASGW
jgi:hypothetical protein